MVYKVFQGYLKSASRAYWIFIFLAFAVPMMALLIPLRPDGVDLPNWFSRSGAAMVVFALLAEAKAISISKMMNASGVRTRSYEAFIDEYILYSIQLNKIAFFTIAMGTLIWGYGDLLIENV